MLALRFRNGIPSASLRSARDDERRDDNLCRKFLQHRFVNANSSVEVFQREILVGRVRAAIGKRQSHQERLDAQGAAKLRDDWDAATFANERDLGVERLAQSSLCRLTDR